MRLVLHLYDDKDGGGEWFYETSEDGSKNIRNISKTNSPDRNRIRRIKAYIEVGFDNNANGREALLGALKKIAAEVRKG